MGIVDDSLIGAATLVRGPHEADDLGGSTRGITHRDILQLDSGGEGHLNTSGGVDKRATLCLFAKPPIAGRVKTRLAAEVGAVRAAELAAAFLADCWHVQWPKRVLATTDASFDFGFDAERWSQGEGDLGARIERILRRAGLGIAIGADSPGFPLGALDDANEALLAGNAAMGRALDGGYWLLGLPECPEGILADLPWSSATTADATEARLRLWGFEVHQVDPWFDIDSGSDLDHFRRRVPRARAPRTWSVLGDG